VRSEVEQGASLILAAKQCVSKTGVAVMALEVKDRTVSQSVTHAVQRRSAGRRQTRHMAKAPNNGADLRLYFKPWLAIGANQD
jgi:hypothetical protein